MCVCTLRYVCIRSFVGHSQTDLETCIVYASGVRLWLKAATVLRIQMMAHGCSPRMQAVAVRVRRREARAAATSWHASAVPPHVTPSSCAAPRRSKEIKYQCVECMPFKGGSIQLPPRAVLARARPHLAGPRGRRARRSYASLVAAPRAPVLRRANQGPTTSK